VNDERLDVGDVPGAKLVTAPLGNIDGHTPQARHLGLGQQRHPRGLAGQAGQGNPQSLCVLSLRRIVPLIIENLNAYLVRRRPWVVIQTLALAPLDGKMMMGIGALIHHGHDELVTRGIVTNPKLSAIAAGTARTMATTLAVSRNGRRCLNRGSLADAHAPPGAASKRQHP
jgi:hypothetical protein